MKDREGLRGMSAGIYNGWHSQQSKDVSVAIIKMANFIEEFPYK